MRKLLVASLTVFAATFAYAGPTFQILPVEESAQTDKEVVDVKTTDDNTQQCDCKSVRKAKK